MTLLVVSVLALNKDRTYLPLVMTLFPPSWTSRPVYFEPAIRILAVFAKLPPQKKPWVLENSWVYKKNLSFLINPEFKKEPEFWKKSVFFFSKKLEFWKTNLSIKKTRVLKKNPEFLKKPKKDMSFEKNPEFWKKSVFFCLWKKLAFWKKNYRSENKTPNLKIIRFTIQISQNK